MPSQINARLDVVNAAAAGGGAVDDWDSPADPDGAPTSAIKWNAGAGAYYQETIEERDTGTTADVVTVRALIIDTAVARAASIDTDDVLTFTDPAGVQRRARAATIRRSELDGIPARLQTTRIELALR